MSQEPQDTSVPDTEHTNASSNAAAGSSTLTQSAVAGQRRPYTYKAQLVLKGLPNSVTEADIRAMCDEFGPIGSVRILPKGEEHLVFLDYPSDHCVATAISALDGTRRWDAVVRAEFARRLSRGSNTPLDFAHVLPDSDRPYADTLTVFVSGMPKAVTQDQIQSIFKPFGAIDHIRMYSQPGKTVASAFVTFTSNAAANHAVGTMNGQHAKFNNESFKLTVHKAKRESRPPVSQGYPLHQAGAQAPQFAPPGIHHTPHVHQHPPHFPPAAAYGHPQMTMPTAMLHPPPGTAVLPHIDPMTGALAYPTAHPYIHSLQQPKPAGAAAVTTTDAYGNLVSVAPFTLGTLAQAGAPLPHGGRTGGYARTGTALRNATMARARHAANEFGDMPGAAPLAHALPPYGAVVSHAYSPRDVYGYPKEGAPRHNDYKPKGQHTYGFYPTTTQGAPAASGAATGASSGQSGEGVTLFVHGIPHGATDSDLYNEFSRVSRVISARIAQDKLKQIRDYGFVTVPTRADADAAINTLNGRPLTLASGASAGSRVMTVKIKS